MAGDPKTSGATASVTDLVGQIFGKRPAEILTLAAGAVGLLAAQALSLENAQPLILIVAAVPAVVSFAVDRFFDLHASSPAVRHREVADELEYATARTIRKAILGDPTWKDDQSALEKLWQLHPGHETAPSQPSGSAKDDK